MELLVKYLEFFFSSKAWSHLVQTQKTLHLVAGSWQIVAFLELACLLLFNWTRNILYQTNNLCENCHFLEELFSIQGRHYQRISQAVVFCTKKCIGIDNGSYKSYSNTTQHDRSASLGMPMLPYCSLTWHSFKSWKFLRPDILLRNLYCWWALNKDWLGQCVQHFSFRTTRSMICNLYGMG